MQRRDLIKVVAGSLATWPLAARAQQPSMPVIGFLNTTSADAYRLRAFHQGLKEAGFVEGENVAVEYRWADNQIDRLQTLAAELVRRQVTLIVAGGGFPSGLAAKTETKSIPILFIAGDDPVKLGLVSSLVKPDGNLTGINILTGEVVTKRLELLRDLLPKAIRIDVLVDPISSTTTESTLRGVDAAGQTMGMQIQVYNASTIGEIDAAFAALGNKRPDALFVGISPFLLDRRVQGPVGGASCDSCNLCGTRTCRSRRANELRCEHWGCISSNWRLCRSCPQGR
jgi:putative ABC transport system substrate-binding protein